MSELAGPGHGSVGIDSEVADVVDVDGRGAPEFEGESDPILASFSRPVRFSADAVAMSKNTPEVHIVWDSAGRLLYVGSSGTTRSRLQQHLTGDREASILHKKVGQMLDEESGAEAPRDAIRK